MRIMKKVKRLIKRIKNIEDTKKIEILCIINIIIDILILVTK